MTTPSPVRLSSAFSLHHVGRCCVINYALVVMHVVNIIILVTRLKHYLCLRPAREHNVSDARKTAPTPATWNGLASCLSLHLRLM